MSFDTPLVSLLVITYNRLAMVRRCIPAALETCDVPFEMIVWDNGCTDGTSEWLDTLSDPRVRVVHASGNLGFNGYALVAMHARAEWLCEIDDDVIAFPARWTSRMLEAFQRVPRLGYLALDVVQDEKTTGAKLDARHYKTVDVGGGMALSGVRCYHAHGPVWNAEFADYWKNKYADAMKILKPS